MLYGTEQHLCRSAPQSAAKRLAGLRARVPQATRRADRLALEKEIESLLGSAPYFRAAYRRHINAQFRDEVIPALERLVELVAECVRRKAQSTGAGVKRG
jgi:uncharacterized protein (DUF885 family)